MISGKGLSVESHIIQNILETIQNCEEAYKVAEEVREKHRGRRMGREGEIGREEAEMSTRLAVPGQWRERHGNHCKF